MPRAPPQENNPDATRMGIPRMCLWYLVVFAMYMHVCLEAYDYRALVANMTNRHGHWMCWMSMGGKNSVKTHGKQQRGTCG